MTEILLGIAAIAAALLTFHLSTKSDETEADFRPLAPLSAPAQAREPGAPDRLIPPARPTRLAPLRAEEIEAERSHNARQREVFLAQMEPLDVPRELPLTTVLVKRRDDRGRLDDVDEISEAECKLPESEMVRRLSGKVGKTYRLGPFYAAFNDTDSAFSIVQLVPEHAFPNATIIPMPAFKFASVPPKTFTRESVDAVMANLRRQATPAAINKQYTATHGGLGLALFESVDARVVDNRVRGTSTKRKLFVYRVDDREPRDPSTPVEEAR